MIPAPIAPPAPRPSANAGSGVVLGWIGGLLLFGAFVGAVSWYAVIAPTSFTRFEASPGSAQVQGTAGQTYVITAEGAGVLDEKRPPPIAITVHGIGGQPVTVVGLAEPPDELTGATYDLLGRQGRVLAKFTPSADGTFLVSVSGLSVDRGAGYAPVPPPRFAVGREIGATWMGTWFGFVLLAVVPLVLGIWCSIAGRRARGRSAALRTPSSSGSPATRSWAGA